MLQDVSDFTAPLVAQHFGTVDPDTGKARVYGGDPNLIHIEDGKRSAIGHDVQHFLDDIIRDHAELRGVATEGKDLCPGCYMVALFNAAVHLAHANGQSFSELGRTMAAAFTSLAENPDGGITEEINVILDPDEEPESHSGLRVGTVRGDH